jgi:peptide/nickel transport system permease protein
MSSASALQGHEQPGGASASSLGPTDISHSQSWLIWHAFRKHRLGMVGLVMLVLMVLAVIFIPIFFPNPYLGVNSSSAFWAAPMGKVDPDNGHVFWLGSDRWGRDNLALLFEAGRLSLTVSIVPTIIVLMIGFLVGALAGYYGGWVDNLLMHVTDFLLALPLLPAYLLTIRLVRPAPRTVDDQIWTSVVTIMVVFVLFGWMGLSRLVRGLVLSLRTQPYIEAARALGASTARILFRHLLPNLAGPMLVAGIFLVGDFIILEALLSYFGLGISDRISPPIVSWGNILANHQDLAWFLTNLNPFQQIRGYLVIFPSILLLVTVLSINFIGDALRDVLDPRRHA